MNNARTAFPQNAQCKSHHKSGSNQPVTDPHLPEVRCDRKYKYRQQRQCHKFPNSPPLRSFVNRIIAIHFCFVYRFFAFYLHL